MDLGCGTGRYADIFGDCYTGVDNNPSYIEAAGKNHLGSFLVADAAKLDFLKQRFDNVLSINTFHHLSDEQVSLAVGQMKKLAIKQIIVVDPVYPSKFNFLGYFLFKIDRGKYRRSYSQHKGLLESLGFKAIRPRLKNSFPYRVCVFRHEIGKI